MIEQSERTWPRWSGRQVRQWLGIAEPRAEYWPADPEHPTTRVCTKCGAEKHKMEFYLIYKTGRRTGDCRVCRRAQMRRRYRQNPEKHRERARRSQARIRGCPERAAQARLVKERWRRKNRALLSEVARRQREGAISVGFVPRIWLNPCAAPSKLWTIMT